MSEVPSNGQGNSDELTRPKKWTNEPPTTPGAYWWRHENSKMAMIVIVTRGGDGRLRIWDGAGDYTWLEKWPTGMWAGPVEPPPIEE
jgi:hypothetical protein